MITQNQTKDLAEHYQIDEFTIMREYLQLLFLSYLYRHKKSTLIYFKGGTAIRLLLNSPRFSEDLDFSTPYSKEQVQEIIKEVEKSLKKELAEIKIFPLYKGKKSIRFKLKYQCPDFKYPFAIRIDFTEKERPSKTANSPFITKFPLVFPVVVHLLPEEILAEKIRALLTRSKGRDVFDLWFLLTTGIKPEKRLIEKKLESAGKKFNNENFVKKIKSFSLRKLKSDLNQFMPEHQRKIISSLKEKLVKTWESSKI